MKMHVLKLSHHLNYVNCTDLLLLFWDLAKFIVMARQDPGAQRHMVMYMCV